jgi:hypothetical protein
MTSFLRLLHLNHNFTLQNIVAVPINLAKSLEGKYFVGYADNLTFGNGTNA